MLLLLLREKWIKRGGEVLLLLLREWEFSLCLRSDVSVEGFVITLVESVFHIICLKMEYFLRAYLCFWIIVISF